VPSGSSVEDSATRSLTLLARPESIGSLVYDTIRAAIVSHALPPGSRVTEASLAAQLAVSKTPVREALLKLKEVGLVEADGRSGGRVVSPSREAFENAFQLREALEAFTVEHAARQANPAQQEEIRSEADRSHRGARAGDVPLFLTADAAFHRAIAETLENQRLWRLLDDVMALVAALQRPDLSQRDTSVECAEAHVEIARLIAERDAVGATTAMRAHIRHVAELKIAGVVPYVEDEI
jgi:DNA-binding GntR family transcriptional regulator